MVPEIPWKAGAVRQPEVPFDVEHIQTITTSALSPAKPLVKELNASMLEGPTRLNIPELCQDWGMLRKLTVQTTVFVKVENG